jgi:hypothetical protein
MKIFCLLALISRFPDFSAEFSRDSEKHTNFPGRNSRMEALWATNLGYVDIRYDIKQTNSGASVRQRTIPTDRTPLVGEVSANFRG